jgi:hypothetical protein
MATTWGTSSFDEHFACWRSLTERKCATLTYFFELLETATHDQAPDPPETVYSDFDHNDNEICQFEMSTLVAKQTKTLHFGEGGYGRCHRDLAGLILTTP